MSVHLQYRLNHSRCNTTVRISNNVVFSPNIFDPRLVEWVDAEPAGAEGPMYTVSNHHEVLTSMEEKGGTACSSHC